MMPESLLIHEKFEAIVSRWPDRIAIQGGAPRGDLPEQRACVPVRSGEFCEGIKRNGQWKNWTYAQVRQEALRIAGFLRSATAGGEHVALILETRPEWIFIYLGIIYAQMTCVPLDVQLPEDDLEKYIRDCSAKIIFCSGEIYQKKIKPSLFNSLLYTIVIDDAIEFTHSKALRFSRLSGSVLDREAVPLVKDEDIASLIYTSGTTDKPKGVLLTHKNICSNFISLNKLQLCSSEDNFLALLPLHHTYPFMATVIFPLLLGARITFCPTGFNPHELSALIKEARITVLVGVPQLFALIYHAIEQKAAHLPRLVRTVTSPFIRYEVRKIFGKSLRLLVSGGARLEPKVAKGLAGFGFRIVEGYGLTETSPVVTFNPVKKVKYGSVGQAISDVQIKILNPDAGGVGEVLIKGPNVMQGYFKQLGLTAGVIKDGWFYSGDLGYIDDEGYLFLTGREKEVIVLGSGKNIYPEELEARYMKSPFIKEICVVDKKEQRFGQEVDSLFAVIVPDLVYFQKAREKNIHGKIRWELENLSRDLPGYQHIMGFTLTKDELPRTALKKLKRYEVKSRYLSHKSSEPDITDPVLAPESFGQLNHEITYKIISYLTKQIHIPITPEQHLEIDLGIDSLTRVELAIGIEKMFGIKIPDEAFYTISSVHDLIQKVSDLIDQKCEKEDYDREVKETSWADILHRPPSAEIVARLKLTPGVGDWIFTAFFKCFYWLILKLFWFLKISKIKPLPLEGPYVICSNHASYLDGFIVLCGLPLRVAVNTYFVGLSAIFDHPSVRWLQRWARLVPIDSNANFIETMQTVSYLLAHKKIVCIFPEGQRSIDGEVKEFKKGIGILLKELKIPAIPVRILGSHFAWSRTKRYPRLHPIRVVFGESLLAETIILEKKPTIIEEYTHLAEELRQQIVKLGH